MERKGRGGDDRNSSIKRCDGMEGEEIAVRYLQREGFTILERNFRMKGGKEIDIICKKGEELHFVEVKTRRSQRYGRPMSAVRSGKVLRITKVAYAFLNKRRLGKIKVRFSIVEVIHDSESDDGHRINFIPDAFSGAF